MPVAKYQYEVGQEVHIKPEYADSWPAKAQVPFSTFVVVERPGGRRTSYVLRHREALGIRIKAKPEHVTAGAHPGFTAKTIDIAPVYDNGTVVEWKDGSQPGLWVVTGYTAKGHQVYPLGGASVGRRNVSGLRLEVVTLNLDDDQ